MYYDRPSWQEIWTILKVFLYSMLALWIATLLLIEFFSSMLNSDIRPTLGFVFISGFSIFVCVGIYSLMFYRGYTKGHFSLIKPIIPAFGLMWISMIPVLDSIAINDVTGNRNGLGSWVQESVKDYLPTPDMFTKSRPNRYEHVKPTVNPFLMTRFKTSGSYIPDVWITSTAFQHIPWIISVIATLFMTFKWVHRSR